jgi:hypothetical protein
MKVASLSSPSLASIAVTVPQSPNSRAVERSVVSIVRELMSPTASRTRFMAPVWMPAIVIQRP